MFISIFLCLALVGCGEGDSSDKEKTSQSDENVATEDQKGNIEEQNNDTSSNGEVNDEEEFNEDTGEGLIESIGYVNVQGVGYNDEVGIDGTDSPLKPIKMGPVNLEIQSVNILDVNPNEDSKELFFNDQDKVKAIVIDMKSENTSDKDITFNPNQATIVTDTGEQLESEMMLMGEAGGDFLGKVKKEGQTWWLLKDPNKDIKTVKLIISPPYQSDSIEDIGDEKRLEFDILSYEEALKKDGKK